MKIKSVSGWKSDTKCPLVGFTDFKEHLNRASFHNAAEYGEFGLALKEITKAARVAIEHGWPYWAMERMFKEVKPLVAWDSFMHVYIEILSEMTVDKSD